MENQISLQATTWQVLQKGRTMRIKPFPPEFKAIVIKERNAEEERVWFVNNVKTNKIIHFAINHEFLDLVGFVTAFNINNNTCEIGIEILDYTNFAKGIGKKAIKQFLQILKNQHHIKIVYAQINPQNKRAIVFFGKVGFTFCKVNTIDKMLFKKFKLCV